MDDGYTEIDVSREEVKVVAVILEKSYSRCQVRLQDGVDGKGDPVFVNRVFGRIVPDTTNQDLYDVVRAVMGLQTLQVYAIRRLEEGELISQ